jgi:hypothetical protein
MKQDQPARYTTSKLLRSITFFHGVPPLPRPSPAAFTMPILIRTPRGDDALRSPDTPLPRRTKLLLIAIDGKTDSSLYIANLSSFGDVAALLETLLRAGLVQARAPVAAAAGQPAPSGATPSQISTWFLTTAQHPGDFENWTDTYAIPLEPGDRRALKPWDMGGSRLAPAAADKPVTDRDSTAQQQVRKAVLLMHNFVATHFAERATELLPAIDKLTSVERIARSLKDYEALVAPAGKAAARHLMDLRATLTRR